MNRIDKAFADNRRAGRKGLIPYFTAGFPTLDDSAELVLAADRAGATVVELGVPFSDPIADGPVIQHSSQIALERGVTLGRILETVAGLRQNCDCPLVLMGYANSFMRYGFERLVLDAKDAGADGLIIPDLPPEEASEVLEAARKAELSIVFLVAQTSSAKRAEMICKAASGFVYYVARLGVTGVSTGVSPLLANNIDALRQYTDLPIAAGFGISTPEQAAQVVQHADAAIIGSALIRLATDHHGPGSMVAAIEQFIAQCVGACSEAASG
ncbi:MAG: tryptophan synthase subunit alpha [Candidatus Alcyoniella australis]|nr:tryptophan synthase subunit alpha [Candidatus Alcyoniella australis]